MYPLSGKMTGTLSMRFGLLSIPLVLCCLAANIRSVARTTAGLPNIMMPAMVCNSAPIPLDSNGKTTNGDCKGKLFLNLEIGNSDFDNITSLFFGNVDYHYSYSNPHIFAFSFDYGITHKITIGGYFAYQQEVFSPDTASAMYTKGTLTTFTYALRYTHCIANSPHFYYGIIAGATFWQQAFNTNTFYDQPAYQPAVRPDAGFLLGARVTLFKNAFLHFEAAFNTPIAYAALGLTYRLSLNN